MSANVQALLDRIAGHEDTRGHEGDHNSTDVLTVEEGARYLRCGRRQLYEAIGRGEVPHMRIGRSIRLSRRALQRVLDGVEQP